MVTRLTERYAGSTGAMSSGEKAFYYIAPDDGEVTFTLSRSSIDLDLFLVVNDDLGDFLQSASTSNTGEPTVSLLIPVTRGQKLYIIVQQDIGEGRYVLSSKLVKKEKSFDLGITEITTTSVEPFNTGENVRFKVEVNNYRDEQSPAYKVVVYDSNGNLLDTDTEPQLSENDYAYTYLDVIMDSSGSHELMFAIEVDGYTDIDPNDNTEYITYEWIGTSDSFNLAITEITTTSVPPFNTDENVRFKVEVEKFNKLSAAYKVVVYDSNGNLLASDTKVQLAQYNHANLAVKMSSSGLHQLTFAIETDDDDDTSDNTKCETYEWIRNSNSFNLAITEITTTSVPPFNTGDDITFNVKVEKFNKLSAAYKVVVYDSNGKLLDRNRNIQLSQYDDAQLTVKMDSSGSHKLTFAIETDDVDDTSDNTKCETYEWKDSSVTPGNKLPTISPVSSSSYLNIAKKLLLKPKNGETYFVNRHGVSEPCRILAKNSANPGALTHDDFKSNLINKGFTNLKDTTLIEYNGATIWKSCAQVDTDGSGKVSTYFPGTSDQYHQDSLSLGGTNCFDSFQIPFIVLPMYNKNNVDLGALGMVIDENTGNYIYVVYADRGPAGVVGEASVETHRSLDFFKNVNQGHDDDSLIYIMFDKSDTTFDYSTLPSRSDIQREGDKLFQKFINDNNL